MSTYFDVKTCRTPHLCVVRGKENPVTGDFAQSADGEDVMLKPFVNAIVAAMMGTGVAKIEEANVVAIHRRFVTFEYVTGPARRNTIAPGVEGPQWITLDEVKRMLDFTMETISPVLDDAAWKVKLAEYLDAVVDKVIAGTMLVSIETTVAGA